MRRKLRKQVGFAGAFRSQLYKVVVSFAVGNEASYLEHLVPLAQLLRVEADGLDDEVDPFPGSELLPAFQKPFDINVRDLNGLQGVHDPGDDAGVFRLAVFHVCDAPHAADQQAFVFFDDGGFNEHALDAQVRESRLITACLVIQVDGDLVDDLVAALLLDRGSHESGLVSVNVVLSEDVLDPFNSGVDRVFVIGGAVLAEQVFQDVTRDDGISLHQFRQVFPDHKTRENLVDFLVQFRHRRHRLSKNVRL